MYEDPVYARLLSFIAGPTDTVVGAQTSSTYVYSPALACSFLLSELKGGSWESRRHNSGGRRVD